MFSNRRMRSPGAPASLRPVIARTLFISALSCALLATSCKTASVQTGAPMPAGWRPALAGLREEINRKYGTRGGWPRVNLGPCGRFAKAFRQQWNQRFEAQVNIAFVMSEDGSTCHHVLIKLPNGNYFDGGNGVISQQKLLSFYQNSRVEEMSQFDPELLDKRSYGLDRAYPECPNYSDDLTARLIEAHLRLLPGTKQGPDGEGIQRDETRKLLESRHLR